MNSEIIDNFTIEFEDDDEKDQYIDSLIKNYGSKLLDHDLYINSMNLSDEEEYLRSVFWTSKFNKKWILLTKEILVYVMKLKNSKDVYNNFIKQTLVPNFKEGIHYKCVDKLHDLVQDYYKNNFVKNNEVGFAKNTVNFYIISGLCFKNLMMEYSKIARAYFIKIEMLAIFIICCIKAYNNQKDKENMNIKVEQLSKIYEKKLQENSSQIEKYEEKINELKLHNKIMMEHANYANSIQFLEKKDKCMYIYIVSTKEDALQGYFKYGITDNLKIRLYSYNSARPKEKPFKYFFSVNIQDAKCVEDRVKQMLNKMNISEIKEFIRIPYNYLKSIILTAIYNYEHDINHIHTLCYNINKLVCDEQILIEWISECDMPKFIIENKEYNDNIIKEYNEILYNTIINGNFRIKDGPNTLAHLINNRKTPFKLNKDEISNNLTDNITYDDIKDYISTHFKKNIKIIDTEGS